MRILVIEDNRILVDTLKQGLTEHGYIVDTATDGESGFAMAVPARHDILILDRMLPKMTGDEICHRLRTSGSSVLILMLTARATVGDRVSGLDLGADDYLAKPFAFAELLARLRNLLRRSAAPTLPILRIENLELNPASHVVQRAGRRIELSVREFSLLEYLLRNSGRVLSREAILDHVWGDEQSRVSNIVDVYITYLRRKINMRNSSNLIHTVRGVGYVLRKKT